MSQIERNFPHGDGFSVDSFLGRLHEERVWDDSEYRKLESAIYDLSDSLNGSDQIARDVAWPLLRIFSYLMMAVSAHFDPDDGFTIRDQSADRLHDRRERAQLVFEGFFKGEMPVAEDSQ